MHSSAWAEGIAVHRMYSFKAPKFRVLFCQGTTASADQVAPSFVGGGLLRLRSGGLGGSRCAQPHGKDAFGEARARGYLHSLVVEDL